MKRFIVCVQNTNLSRYMLNSYSNFGMKTKRLDAKPQELNSESEVQHRKEESFQQKAGYSNKIKLSQESKPLSAENMNQKFSKLHIATPDTRNEQLHQQERRNPKDLQATISQPKHIRTEDKFKFQKAEEQLNPNLNHSKYDHLYGYEVVEAALKSQLRKCIEIYVLDSLNKDKSENFQRILNISNQKEVPIIDAANDKLNRLTNNKPHDGFVMKCEKRSFLKSRNFEYFEKKTEGKGGHVALIINEITDSTNFGSIIRSSFVHGVSFLLINRTLEMPVLSPAVLKVSSGAAERMEFYELRGIERFISKAYDKSWKVIDCYVEKEGTLKPREPKEPKEATSDTLNTLVETTLIKQFSKIPVTLGDNTLIIINAGPWEHQKHKSHYQINLTSANNHPTLDTNVAAGILINRIVENIRPKIN